MSGFNGGGGGGGGGGTVTHTGGALTNNAAVFGNGAADIKVDPNITTDGSGDLTAVTFTASGAGTGAVNLTTGAMTVGAAGQVKVGANTGNVLSVSANGGAVTAVALTASPTLTTPTFSGNIGGTLQLGTQALTSQYPNDGVTGTTVNLLAKVNASGNAILPATTDQQDVLGVCVSGCGTSSNSQIAIAGQVTCIADNTVTAGDYIGVGTTTAGRCKSLSAFGTYPSSNLQVIGRAQTSAAAGATFTLQLYPTLKTTSSGNVCTSSPAPGNYTPAGTANAVECLGNGTYTLPNSVTTLSNNNTVILCTGPGAIIARGGAGSGIKFTGNQSGIVGCTLDDGAFTTTARFVEMAGSDNFVKNVIHQNSGAATGTFPTVDATGGSVRATVDGMLFAGTQVDSCIGANSAATGAITVTEPRIRNVIVNSFAPTAASTIGINWQQPNTSNLLGGDMQDITMNLGANTSGTIGINILGQVAIESTATYRYNLSRVKMYVTAAGATNIIAVKLFGVNWMTVDDLLIDDNGHAMQGYLAEGDEYHVTRNNIVIKSADNSGVTPLVSCTDCAWGTLTNFTINGVSGNSPAIKYVSQSNPTTHNIIGPGSIKFTGQGIGVWLLGNASGKPINYNTVTNVDFNGAGTATSTGVLLDIANSSTGTNNAIIGNNFSGFNGASSVDIKVNNAAISLTTIANNTFDNADVAHISDSGTSTQIISPVRTVRLTADSSGVTATTPGTTIFTFGALPTNANYNLYCAGTYSQATSAAANGIAIQGATNAPTRIDAWGIIYTTNAASAAPALSNGNLANLTTTTATGVVTATPSATATTFQWSLDAMIQVGTSATTLNVNWFTGNASDAVTIKAGSYCTLTA